MTQKVLQTPTIFCHNFHLIADTVSLNLRAIEEGTQSSFINKWTDYFLWNEQDRGKCFPVYIMIPRLPLTEQDANKSQYSNLSETVRSNPPPLCYHLQEANRFVRHPSCFHYTSGSFLLQHHSRAL